MPALPEQFDPALVHIQQNLNAALDLARRGAFIFPCKSEGGPGVVKTPQLGSSWPAISTRDETTIRRWWQRHPKSIPAIDLNKTGRLVVDCDVKLNDGLAWLIKYLAARNADLEGIPFVETPSGGRHHVFLNPDKRGNGRGTLPPKKEVDIDMRGAGGYIIGPGSIFTDGTGEYVEHGSIFDAPEPPQWLNELLSPKPIAFVAKPYEPVSDARLAAYGQAALDELASELASKVEGERNEAANLIAFRAGRLVGGGCITAAVAYDTLANAALSWGITHRDKALGPKGTIARAIRDGQKSPAGPHDDPAPNIEISLAAGETLDEETGEIIDDSPFKEASDYPDALLDAPGLINDIADWIMDTSMFPCRLFSVAAALSAVGTAVGRQVYTGVPRTGSALYWLIVAPTASGKDRPQEAIKQLFEAANLSHLVKSSVSSSAKLGMSLHEKPLQIQVIDEVGKVLRKFVGRNASTQEMALLDDYCSVWGKNLGSFTPEGVTTRTDVMIRRPSLTLFGATTPINFYKQLRNEQIAGGFLNRFLVLHRFQRVTENKSPLAEDEVPRQFIEAIQSLHTFQDGLIQRQSIVSTLPEHAPSFHVVPASADAERKMAEYRAKTRDMIYRSDEDPIFEIWARSAEMVKRMALILACARHYNDMTECRIEDDDVVFASNLVDWSMTTFMEGMQHHVAENEYQANSKMVLNLIRKAGRGGISKSALYKKVDHKLSGRDIQAVTTSLAEAGSILVKSEPIEGKGRPKITYVYERNR